jgi:hypothetical protein
MWVLILIAVHINNPKDVPAKATMEFNSEQSCLESLRSLTYWIKFENFKLEGRCQKKS